MRKEAILEKRTNKEILDDLQKEQEALAKAGYKPESRMMYDGLSKELRLKLGGWPPEIIARGRGNLEIYLKACGQKVD